MAEFDFLPEAGIHIQGEFQPGPVLTGAAAADKGDIMPVEEILQQGENACAEGKCLVREYSSLLV